MMEALLARTGFYPALIKRIFEILNYYRMNNFKIVPLSATYAERIKLTMQDDFGHTVIEQTATGAGPCRVSLKPFKKGIDNDS